MRLVDWSESSLCMIVNIIVKDSVWVICLGPWASADILTFWDIENPCYHIPISPNNNNYYCINLIYNTGVYSSRYISKWKS